MHRSQPAGFIVDCQTSALDAAAASRNAERVNLAEQPHT